MQKKLEMKTVSWSLPSQPARGARVVSGRALQSRLQPATNHSRSSYHMTLASLSADISTEFDKPAELPSP